jgi:superfamily II DNA or RNA helicase
MRSGIEDEVADLVREIGTTCKMEDCVDVPEQVFETVFLELTPKQKKAIKEIEEPQSIVRWTKTHAIEQGVKSGDEYVESEYIDNMKTDYILSYAEENPKFSVICRYNLQIKMLKEELEKKGKKVFVINGEVKNRDEVVQEVERTEACVVIIQASCSVGFEIPSVPIMIFASLSFSFVDHEQSLGRIHRINKLKKNLYIYLVVKDGVDEGVYNCIMSKKDFNIAIYRV